MRLFVKDKKGADKVLSVYWFVILILISGGVFAMAYSFYGNPYDVREIESGILTEKVSDCLSSRGILNSNLVSGSSFSEDFRTNFLNECGFNFDSPGEWNNIQYFVYVEFYNLTEMVNPIYNFSSGDINLIGDCEIKTQKGKDYERIVKCDEKRFYSLDDSNKQYLIKVLSGVRKSEKNVKL